VPAAGACYYQPGPEFLEEDLFGSLRTAAAALDPRMAELAASMGAAFEANSSWICRSTTRASS